MRRDKKHIRIMASVLLGALALGVMAFIFAMSAQPAARSKETSGGTVRAILRVVCSDFESLEAGEQDALVEQYQHLVRKGAHFCAYALLGALVFAALYLQKPRRLFCLAAATGIGALYAVSDELHQRFVPGRSGQLRDVALDSCGALFGACFVLLIVLIVLRARASSHRSATGRIE